jgi:hypothetical protein
MELGDLKVTVTIKKEKGKNPEPLTAIIPANQVWMYYALNEQKQALDSINGKLAFIVFIIILGIIIGMFRGCSGI